MPITIEEDPTFSGFNQAIIQNIINTVFEKEGYTIDNIALVFGNDDLLNSLKKEFFKKDHLTDVIAFRLNDYAEKNVEGEIYISVPRAKENAKSFKEPFAKEVGRLIIHGGLHLLNYDDETKEDKDTMTGKEEAYLKQCQWQNLIHE
ncbi:MAG TPA: rRNA maturation RNase YbeY [Candidatus Marinimicrobia bacterium]|jgi:rRNA maturation RNase YbeY|nr:rRNA maturation RNase YbeY [Candidatus Neomarinimicrobiota bacterium]HIA90955.1 rRNA maturation RNase YbeY [Candidatus Neomarinimicrobiota bacterium]HIB61030.1 rRNA maturation RNase YbeY [Candidatus Neomarinimicrobiota bacterium]